MQYNHPMFISLFPSVSRLAPGPRLWSLCISLMPMFLGVGHLTRGEDFSGYANQGWLNRRAQVMPAGRRALQFTTQVTQVEREFSVAGKPIALGDKTRAVSFKDLVTSQGGGAVQDKADWGEYLDRAGISPTDSAMIQSTRLKLVEQLFQIEYAYGLTNGWMFAVKLPLAYRTVQAHSRLERTPVFEKLIASGKTRADVERNASLQKASEQAYAENGAVMRQQAERTDFLLGDVETKSQFALFQGPPWWVSTRSRVRWPTARSSDPYAALPMTAGDGQLDIGQDILVDWEPISRLAFYSLVGFTVQFPDHLRMRVSAEEAGGALDRKSVDPEVRRDLGDIFHASLTAEYQWLSWLKPFLNGAFTHKDADHFDGDRFDQSRYQALRGGAQHYTLLTVGVSLARNELSELPMISQSQSLQLAYTRVLQGRNTPATEVGSLNFVYLF